MSSLLDGLSFDERKEAFTAANAKDFTNQCAEVLENWVHPASERKITFAFAGGQHGLLALQEVYVGVTKPEDLQDFTPDSYVHLSNLLLDMGPRELAERFNTPDSQVSVVFR